MNYDEQVCPYCDFNESVHGKAILLEKKNGLICKGADLFQDPETGIVEFNTIVMDFPYGYVAEAEVHFCPMCGRKLKE